MGIAETAENATQTLSGILEMKARLEQTIHANFGKRGNNANLLLQYLFKKPIVSVNQVILITQCSYKTANDLVAAFMKIGLLKEMTGQNRNRRFVFDEYLKLFT